MIDLRTLGASELEEHLGSGTRPIAIQAKRLALVTYLALAGRGRYRRRDSVVALFWPELDEDHARSALRQGLSYLRRTLGPSVLVTRGDEEIALAPDALRCDTVLFDEAVGARRHEAAMALYHGDFLDGLFVSDASPEIGQWIDAERARLRQSAATCAWSLSESSRERGDSAGAAAWGRRAASLAPDDEARLRWLIAMHDSIGDRAGAVEAYDRFARRLAAEYAAQPSAETQALMAAVRSRSIPSPRAPSVRLLESPPWTDTPRPNGPASPASSGHSIPPRVPQTAQRAALAAALVLAGLLAYAASRPHDRRSEHTLVVLPVKDLAPDTGPPYLTDVLTEQLVTDLARWPELRVIRRRMSGPLQESQWPVVDSTRARHIGAVLTSAVARAGDSVRLTVRLTRDGDGRTTWSSSARGARRDLLLLTQRVADSVATHALGVEHLMARPTIGLATGVDPAALDLYIRGRYAWNKRGAGLWPSIQLFTAALDRDPTFALAYSGLGDAYVQLGYASLLRPSDAFPKARAAAMQALALDPTLAEPHATLGFVKFYYEWDWLGAEAEFSRALALNPSYASGHEWYGLFLAAMGRFDEALEHEHRAQALDPLSPAIAGTTAWVLYYAGRNEEAERELRLVLRADSTFALGRLYLGRVHQARGRLDSALAEYRVGGPLREWVPTLAAVGAVYGLQGRRREALGTLAHLDSLSRVEYVTAYAVALVYASLGQRDSAFAWLDRGMTERTHWMVWLRRDPRWAPIRSDLRFTSLVRRMKLPR
jgi:DNA-binding SARP family transcriptional activator/TolB-like protein/Tfp pilus assembly protein PilF